MQTPPLPSCFPCFRVIRARAWPRVLHAGKYISESRSTKPNLDYDKTFLFDLAPNDTKKNVVLGGLRPQAPDATGFF